MKKLLFLLLLPCFIQAQTFNELARFQSAAGKDTVITGQGSQLTLGQNILLPAAGSGSADANNIGYTSYRSVQINIVPASGTVTAGAITFEQSNDNFVSTAVPLYLYDVASVTAIPVTTYTLAASTPRTFAGNIACKYVRARISTGVTGTTTGVQAFTTYRTTSFTHAATYVYNPTAANFQTTATQTGTWTVQIGNTPNTTAILTETRTGTTNASTSVAVNSAASNNATSQKASAGIIYSICANNTTASTKYVRIYNKASSPTVGTDIPVLVIAIPANLSKEISFGDVGLKLATGIAFAITGGGTATDNTAVAAADVQLIINYN